MENQHYVPKSYLKHFLASESDEIFAIQFFKAGNKWSRPKKYHINSICFSGDFYNLDLRIADYHSVNTDIIERDAFWYEKYFIADIVEQAEKEQLNVEAIPDLAFFLLSMKSRNPRFRNGYTQEKIDKNLKKSIEELNSELEQIGNPELIKVAKSVIDELSSKPPKSKELHNGSILRAHSNNNAVFKSVLNRVVNYNIVIYRPKKPEDTFITTDSPGYSVDKDKAFFDTKYIDDLYHFIPISSQLAICFHNPDFYKPTERITYQELNSEEIFQLNYGSAVNRTKNIYSSNEATLNDFVKRVFSKK
jgi:hypothetical protein